MAAWIVRVIFNHLSMLNDTTYIVRPDVPSHNPLRRMNRHLHDFAVHGWPFVTAQRAAFTQ